MPSYSILTDASRLPSTPVEAQGCVTDALRAHMGAKLGCGEQGCTYELVEEPTHVIKVTPFRSADDGAAWANEARIGAELGELGIAPRIYHYFRCEVGGTPSGFIVMDRLRDAKTVLDVDGQRVVVRVKTTDPASGAVDVEDHLAAMPRDVQRGFADVLAAMIAAGYVHNDCHIENLGFLKRDTASGRSAGRSSSSSSSSSSAAEKPIVFDFGFTRACLFTSSASRALALAFSICQMLEHVPVSELEESLLYTVFTGTLNGSWTWGAPYTSASETSLAALGRLYPVPRGGAAGARAQVAAWKAAADGAHVPHEALPFFVGCACYATLLPLARRRRYDSALMDTIYLIRQGKPY